MLKIANATLAAIGVLTGMRLMRLVQMSLLSFAIVMAVGYGAAGAAGERSYWGGPGSGDGQFFDPWDAAVAPGGHVYVADRGNHRVQYFSASGEYLGQWGAFGSDPGEFGDDLVALAVSPTGDVYTLDQIADGGDAFRVQRFDDDGTFEAGWGTAEGSALGEFDEPSDIAVGPTGRVYLIETGNRRVQSFEPDGSSPAAWGTTGGDGEGEFSEPVGVAVDPSSGVVYVADAGGTARVQAFSPSGEFLRQWGSTGSGEGQFLPQGLTGVAVGPEGDVYTREQLPEGGSRYQRFTEAGGFAGMTYWTESTEPHGLAAAYGAIYAPDTGGGRLHVIDLVTPSVSLLGPYTPVTTGTVVIFQSTASVPLGQIVDYEWDLDGDGVYELDSGSASEVTHVYQAAGRLQVGLRVTSNLGGVSVNHREVNIVAPPLAPPPSPSGPAGVTINNGAHFTDDPNVTVTVRWPRGAVSLLIANDGGFIPALSMPIAARVPWRLDSAGPERLPRTIYVRFRGGESGPETYQDDIVLDQTAPQIPEATLHSRRNGVSRLHLEATDNVSGIALMQLTGRHGKPGKWTRFARSRTLRGSLRGLSVRVRDRAGNPSRWVRVQRQCQGCR